MFTIGDGNCFGCSISKSFWNHDGKHIELHARIVMEGIINIEYYLHDDFLQRGATWIHDNAELPLVFATFSEFYTPGQRMTKESIRYIYTMEMYSCSQMGSYMGIWQMAQAALVLRTPIHVIYPVRGECTIRYDFHRTFFPINYTMCNDEYPITIMWTGI